ncbi:MAG: DinB family protein [Chitinophagales bacterium]
MTEQEQLSKLFSDLFDGSPWIDVNIMSTVDEITAKEAATKVFPNFNSIWEIVNHLISWRETVLKRLKGEEIESPEDNYFSYIRDRTEPAWTETKDRFRESQAQWIKAIKKFRKKDLQEQHASGPFTNYDLISGILEHDAYHLGQIRLLLKLIRFRA